MSIRQVNGFGDSGMSSPGPPMRQAQRWTGSTNFPTNGRLEGFFR